jgi:catechol 2,3-dioxygenase-like lactoylglutathione lyase family enzyme
MLQRINHVSITVKDLDHVIDWFRDKFGCTDIGEPYAYEGELIEKFTGLPGAHTRVRKVKVQDFVLEFIQYLSPPGKELKGNMNDVGYPHIGFVVDDIDRMYDDLRQKGVRFRSPPCKVTDETSPVFGWQLVFLDGPEGMTLELVQSPR